MLCENYVADTDKAGKMWENQLQMRTLSLYVCQVNSILRHVGELLNYESDEQLEELYQKSAWFFDRKYGKPGSSYEAFKLAVT